MEEMGETTKFLAQQVIEGYIKARLQGEAIQGIYCIV